MFWLQLTHHFLILGCINKCVVTSGLKHMSFRSFQSSSGRFGDFFFIIIIMARCCVGLCTDVSFTCVTHCSCQLHVCLIRGE